MSQTGGFPTRPTRDAFGPTRADDGVVVDPEKYVSADTFNLDHWQVAGCGLVVPRAWALISSAGALLGAAEAWDPRAVQTDPVAARTAEGVYTLTYATTYLNKDGVAIATALIAGAVHVQALGNEYAAVAVPRSDGRIVDIEITRVGSGPTDEKHLVLLW